MEIDGTVLLSPLPPYIPPRKENEKLVKESKGVKYDTFKPLFLNSV